MLLQFLLFIIIIIIVVRYWSFNSSSSSSSSQSCTCNLLYRASTKPYRSVGSQLVRQPQCSHLSFSYFHLYSSFFFSWPSSSSSLLWRIRVLRVCLKYAARKCNTLRMRSQCDNLFSVFFFFITLTSFQRSYVFIYLCFCLSVC